MLFHFTFQQCAGAMETIHCLRQDAEQLRCLLDAHALDQPGDDDTAECFRKLVDCALKQGADLALSHRLVGVEFTTGARECNNLTVQGGVLADEVDIDDRPPAPQAAKRLVDDDAGKPSADPRLAAEGMLKART